MKNPPKEKVKEWNARYYQKTKNDPDKQARRTAWAKQRYQENFEFVTNYKLENTCLVCRESDPIVLEFHHIDPELKEVKISSIMGGSRERLVSEIAKCVVVCANCHRRIHAGVVSIGNMIPS